VIPTGRYNTVTKAVHQPRLKQPPFKLSVLLGCPTCLVQGSRELTHLASASACFRLTAFVVKVLSLSQKYQAVDSAGIRGSVQWLLGKQESDGSFVDSNPVYHRDMQGGVGGLRGGPALTAFVTIALKEALPLYEAEEDDEEAERQKQEQLSNLRNSLDRATTYLARALNDQSLGPYPVAISSYALALASEDQSAISVAGSRLKELSMEDNSILSLSSSS
ncbi:complement C4-B-like, partial [Python bivittatus]|uniref:Complement C4-B-like n=1 Tax=Python bivittatus TaxID=176946 RepID=A0A9F2RE06_PYTBI